MEFNEKIIWKKPRKLKIDLIKWNPFIKEQAPTLVSYKNKNSDIFAIQQTQAEHQEKNKIIWKSTERIWEIDWYLLMYELKNFEAPWKSLSIGQFLKSFAIACVHLILSTGDIISDGLLAYTYFHGTEYEYMFLNNTDPDIERLNCKPLGNHTGLNGHDIYTYWCFSQDRILGYITLILMVLPGTLFSAFIFYDLNEKTIKPHVWIFVIAISPILWTMFPLLVFLNKVVSLFHYDPMWQRLSKLISFCEMLFESLPQCILQFIIMMPLFAGERCPLWLQLTTGIFSLFLSLTLIWETFQPTESFINEEDTLLNKVYKVLWAKMLPCSIFLNNMESLLFAILYFWKIRDYCTSTSHQMIILIFVIIQIIWYILSLTFIYNFLEKSKQSKFLILIYAICLLFGFITSITILPVYVSNYPFQGIGGLIMIISFLFNQLSLSMVHFLAFFTAEKLDDLYHLDKLTSIEICSFLSIKQLILIYVGFFFSQFVLIIYYADKIYYM